MAVSAKNLDPAFQSVGQRMYPFIVYDFMLTGYHLCVILMLKNKYCMMTCFIYKLVVP